MIVGILVAVLLAALVNTLSSPASAETIEIPVAEATINGAEGETVALGSVDVPEDLVGRSCDVVAVVSNQASMHAGNELVVSSGESTATIAGVEDAVGSVTLAGGTITLGSTVTVAVKLGPDGVSSLGSTLTVTCAALPPATPAAPVVTTPTYTG